MTERNRAPRLDEKQAMVARLVTIGLAYGLYRLLETRDVIGGALAGLGFLMIVYGYITMFSTRDADRSEMLRVGQTILGLGLVALGLFRVFG